MKKMQNLLIDEHETRGSIAKDMYPKGTVSGDAKPIKKTELPINTLSKITK